MFKKLNIENPEKISEPDEPDENTESATKLTESDKKVKTFPETGPETGSVPTEREYREEREKHLDDPTRWRDVR